MAGYCTRDELKAAIQKTNSDDDTLLDALIEDASRAIDKHCKRPDGFVAVTVAAAREYGGSGRRAQRIDDCVSISKVEVKDWAGDDSYTEWAATDWVAAAGAATNPLYHRTPYNLLICAAGGGYSLFPAGDGGPTVRVTAKWGYAATCPGPIRRATVMQVARWYKRLQSGMTDTLASPELGGVMLYQSELDPAIKWILNHGWVRYDKGIG